MYNPLPYLPGRFRWFLLKLQSLKVPSKLVFFTMGILATTWFLIRVIPKPSRAGYPCMQATAPFMSAFVLYLSGIGSSAVIFSQSGFLWKRSNFLATILLVLFIGLTMLFPISQNALFSPSRNLGMVKGFFPPNTPIGNAQGIFPGRVVWMWDPDATNPGCTNTSNNNGMIDPGDNIWFMSPNNNIAVIDSMMIKSILCITGKNSPAGAWDTLFRYFNSRHGNGNRGYTAGEKILVKINETSAYGGLAAGRFNDQLMRTDVSSLNAFSSETNPYVVLSLLRQLVHQAGIPETMIYVGDPARNIYKEFYDLWHSEFPGVHVLGNNLIYKEIPVESIGRTPVAVTSGDKVFFSDHGTVMPFAITDRLFTIFEDATYLINVPALKAHATAGITLAAKNHFGSFTREWAMHLHPGLMDSVDNPKRLGYGLYRVQTDIMMHNLLSGKNLLILVDGTYPGEDALGVPEKWEMPPFSHNWCSSIFMSLDPVAIESVCHDFLRTEYNGPTIPESRPNWFGVDDYLHQAADSAVWPKGLKYDPDKDGILIASLGVHEHWNDSLRKQYTRNMGTGSGIELFRAHEAHIGTGTELVPGKIKVFPNPANEEVHVTNAFDKQVKYELLDLEGKCMLSGEIAAQTTVKLAVSGLSPGTYLMVVKEGSVRRCEKIVIKY